MKTFRAVSIVSVLALVGLPLVSSAAVAIQITGSLPSQIVVGTPITFKVNYSDMNSPVYRISDSFASTSITATNLSNGVFSWTPNTSDIGMHILAVNAYDLFGNNASTATSFSVVNNASVFPTSKESSVTAAVGVPISIPLSTTVLQRPAYSLTDLMPGTLTSAAIDTNGTLTWTPSTKDVGTHEVTVLAKDAYTSASTTLIVQVQAAGLAITNITASSTAPGATYGFQAQAAGFVNPSYIVLDSFPGTSVRSTNMSQQGTFSWSPQSSDLGTHVLSVLATDDYGHKTNAVQVKVVVKSVLDVVQTDSSSGIHIGAQFTKALKIGSRGTEVTNLQTVLANAGYSVSITGYFGPATQRALKQFQRDHGITPTGTVGPATRAVLNQ